MSESKNIPFPPKPSPKYLCRLIQYIFFGETELQSIEDGAGKMAIEFFTAYSSSEMLGQMMKAQNADIKNFIPTDAFKVEESILLGDPSLRIGCYPRYLLFCYPLDNIIN